MSMIEQYRRLKTPIAVNDEEVVTTTSTSLKPTPNVSVVRVKRPASTVLPRIPSRPKKKQRSKNSAIRLKNMSDAAMKRFMDGLSENSNHVKFQMAIPEQGLIPIHIGTSRTRGTRSYMEDRHCIISDLHGDEDPSSSCCFAAVYDGHNGASAAQHAADRLHQILASDSLIEKVAKNTENIADEEERAAVMNSMGIAFAQVEKEIIEMTLKQGKNDGATALVSMLLGGHLFVANIGDSRAVVARDGHHAKRLSIDHKPDLPAEKERIEASGGKVLFSGCWRVAHDKVPVRLAVSRSFGDHQLKNNLPPSCTAPLVSAHPFVDSYKLSKDDQFVILASDGLWDRLSDDDAVQIVRDEIMTQGGGKWIPTDSSVQAATDKLIEAALKKRTFDNVTVVVMAFEWHHL